MPIGNVAKGNGDGAGVGVTRAIALGHSVGAEWT
jgi:hypothetical protein